MRPTDEEFEIVEEIVEDLDYFYEEEELISGTIKIRKKLLIRNILLGILIFLIMTTVLGFVQISIYCDGRENTVVTPSYKDKVVYLDTTENLYEDLIAFYSVNSNNVKTGTLFEGVRIISGETAINNVSSSKSQTFVNSYIEKMSKYYDSQEEYYKLLPGNKKNDEYYELHLALFSCLDSCLSILDAASSSELDISSESNIDLLNLYEINRTNLMSCWQNANEKL